MPGCNHASGIASLIREVVVLDFNPCGWNRLVATESVNDYAL